MAIQNPGSALGEAIGAQMEIVINEYLEEIVKIHSCHLISKGNASPATGRPTKLLMYDSFGNNYNIDSVITNESMQPLILIESKYSRYTKHNRDKGSWLCTAHSAIKRRYTSIRSSIAILAGNWSRTSIAMIKSNDINIFLIPFDKIVVLLKKHNIEFQWGEKDRDIASDSWKKYSQLNPTQKRQIACGMIKDIKPLIKTTVEKILDNNAEREIENVIFEMHTNLGDVKRFLFQTISDAMDFLEDFTIEEMFNNQNALTIFDSLVAIPDDNNKVFFTDI